MSDDADHKGWSRKDKDGMMIALVLAVGVGAIVACIVRNVLRVIK